LTAPLAVGKINLDPFQAAARLVGPELVFLVLEDLRVVRLDPMKGRGQLHPVRARIETRPEAEDGVHAGVDCELQKLVNDPSAQRHGPGDNARGGHRFGDSFAAFSRQLGGERVAEQSILALSLELAVIGDPESRI
jgi:hypothetical protein